MSFIQVVDKTFVEWTLPDFTTTTLNDTTICSVLLMSTLQKYDPSYLSLPCSYSISLRYFSYGIGITCGIPSVTLLGDKADWLRLLARLDRLPELGDEPAEWADMLRPILTRFVSAFDGHPDIQFWSHVVNRDDSLCGTDYLSGWITAFCMWDCDGKRLGIRGSSPSTLNGHRAIGSIMSRPGELENT